MVMTCDRCFAHVTVNTREEGAARGWQPRYPDTPASGYGWLCPECVGQPLILPRAKRLR
jgi:hypothetical protein